MPMINTLPKFIIAMKAKIFSLLLVLTITISTSAREVDIISFYFNKEALLPLTSVAKFSSKQYGKYELKNIAGNEARRAAGSFIYVDDSGIFLKKNKLISIGRDVIREDSRYSIKDNYIFGVLENDSLPVALDGEMYYFLVPSKTYLMKNTEEANRMMQISKERYVLFSPEENGYYSAIVVDFINGGIELRDIVLTAKGDNSINQIEKKEALEVDEYGMKTYILSPNKDEWTSFIFSKCLETYDAYIRVKG